MKPKMQFVISTLLVLGLAACNLPISEGASSSDSAGATITALAATIQAQGNQAVTDTPTNPAPTDTAQPTETATITVTPSPSVPTVVVSQTTNCRTGPGTQYDLLGSMAPGQSATIIGKYTAGNYWIINNPNSPGSCWLWGQYATVSGNLSGLPEMTPPATPTPTMTPTPAAPAAPKHFDETHSCTSGGLLFYNVHVAMTWQDLASNEDGYYLYRNGTLLVTLAPNTISYADDTTLGKLYQIGHPKPSVDYQLQAFNSQGKSDMREINVSCP